MIALNSKKNLGLTLVELLVVISILAILGLVILTSFIGFRSNQSLQKDAELVVELLNQARNQTISSKNLSQYGVNFSTSTATVFTGSVYSALASDNEVHNLLSASNSISVSLNGGSSSVVFERLSGGTNQNGTITLTSSGLSGTKTVTIYSTGVISSN
ncbi:MAG: type II secretion system protein [Minisyncoccia bacterium]